MYGTWNTVYVINNIRSMAREKNEALSEPNVREACNLKHI